MKTVQLFLGHAGYCLAKEHHAIQGGRRKNIKFHALWGLIHHPEKGYILYDTGYTERFYTATKSFPNKIYALSTQVVATPKDEVKTQLQQYGIQAKDIQHIIVTHFHADHVGGLKDFPNATIYASKTAVNHTLGLSNTWAFRSGVLKDLLPKQLKERSILIDEQCNKQTDEHFGYKYDLFGDKSIYVYDLAGHAAGQIGIMLQTEKKPYFLIADACWLKKSYQENVLPSSIVKLFFHNWGEFKQTLKKINQFHIDNPNTVIVPTHCEETTSQLIQSKINLNDL